MYNSMFIINQRMILEIFSQVTLDTVESPMARHHPYFPCFGLLAKCNWKAQPSSIR